MYGAALVFKPSLFLDVFYKNAKSLKKVLKECGKLRIVRGERRKWNEALTISTQQSACVFHEREGFETKGFVSMGIARQI